MIKLPTLDFSDITHIVGGASALSCKYGHRVHGYLQSLGTNAILIRHGACLVADHEEPGEFNHCTVFDHGVPLCRICANYGIYYYHALDRHSVETGGFRYYMRYDANDQTIELRKDDYTIEHDISLGIIKCLHPTHGEVMAFRDNTGISDNELLALTIATGVNWADPELHSCVCLITQPNEIVRILTEWMADAVTECNSRRFIEYER